LLAAVAHPGCSIDVDEDEDDEEDTGDAAAQAPNWSAALAGLAAVACGAVVARRAVKQSHAMAQLLAATASAGDDSADPCAALRTALTEAAAAELAPSHPFVQGAADALQAFESQQAPQALGRLNKRQRPAEAHGEATEPALVAESVGAGALALAAPVAGRGRGVSNLPAWMSDGPTGQVAPDRAADNSCETASPTTDGQRSTTDDKGSAPHSAPREATHADRSQPSASLPSLPPSLPPGQSRGVVNLPAWMTKGPEEGQREGAPKSHESEPKRARTSDATNVGEDMVLALAAVAVGGVEASEAHSSAAAAFLRRRLLVPSAHAFLEQLSRDEPALCEVPAIGKLLR
jgi:hypothetical protein